MTNVYAIQLRPALNESFDLEPWTQKKAAVYRNNR